MTPSLVQSLILVPYGTLPSWGLAIPDVEAPGGTVFASQAGP
jgi:hypothetical protein